MSQSEETDLEVAARSRIMRGVRQKHTKPELKVRSALHAMGYRFRLHRRDLPGCPDIVLPRHHSIIQIHGCFWHQHQKCSLTSVPRKRTEYWLPKLARNVERDMENQHALTALGWRVLVIWECEVEPVGSLQTRIAGFLKSGVVRSKRRRENLTPPRTDHTHVPPARAHRAPRARSAAPPRRRR